MGPSPILYCVISSYSGSSEKPQKSVVQSWPDTGGLTESQPTQGTCLSKSRPQRSLPPLQGLLFLEIAVVSSLYPSKPKEVFSCFDDFKSLLPLKLLRLSEKGHQKLIAFAGKNAQQPAWFHSWPSLKMGCYSQAVSGAAEARPKLLTNIKEHF